ncbi:hypothetical protein F5X97DRAFT_318425 [Nemania serpens]|nr:hypothetical protein F5X97DRAFT_318425 [Nemania serpens]
MKPNDTIAIIVAVLILGIFIAFYVFMRCLRDNYDDNDSDSDGSSLPYISPLSSQSQIDVYVSDGTDVLPRPPPRVHVFRDEPWGPEARAVPINPRPENGDGDGMAPDLVDVEHPGDR